MDGGCVTHSGRGVNLSMGRTVTPGLPFFFISNYLGIDLIVRYCIMYVWAYEARLTVRQQVSKEEKNGMKKRQKVPFFIPVGGADV